MTSKAVVEAKNLDLTFRAIGGPMQALKDVNLSIDKGEFVGFIGPSGCGKTTFLRVMAAPETPTGGTITVNGGSPEEARGNRAYGYGFRPPDCTRGGASPAISNCRWRSWDSAR